MARSSLRNMLVQSGAGLIVTKSENFPFLIVLRTYGALQYSTCNTRYRSREFQHYCLGAAPQSASGSIARDGLPGVRAPGGSVLRMPRSPSGKFHGDRLTDAREPCHQAIPYLS